jgi:hypothetical protein
MRGAIRLVVLVVCAAGLLAFPAAAAADHATRPHTPNLHALGHSPHPATFFGVPAAQRNVNSDIAFWGDLIFNGNYDGFRIIKNRPGNPKEITWAHCAGDQGDIVVWDDILVRSWNTPAPAGATCDGQPVPEGFEGFHVWDISDIKDPKVIGSVELSARAQADAFGCGSHTATLAPDLENDRLLIYNLTSGGACPFIGIIEVPLDDPASTHFLRNEPLNELGPEDAGHDQGVILGDVNLLVAAAHDMTHVYDVGDNAMPGGSLEDPQFLYTIQEPGVCFVPNPTPPDPQRPCNGFWHSASLSWDGEVIVLGWEPGGGSQPECEATDPPVKKSAFFYDAKTGAKLGQWTLPRPQSAAENCTIHNYNVVPLRNGRDVLVVGNYQAGTWVVDFTDPANPVTVAWSDPPPLQQVTNPAGQLVNELGGAWSSYWYNGFIYESEITKGLNVFRLSGPETSGAIKLPHLNPQTQEFSIDDDDDDDDDDRGKDRDDDDDRDKDRGKGRDKDRDDD